MSTRRLGERGPTVGAMGLGCMTMSPSYGPGDADEGMATMAEALARGVTFFDTANSYARGANEELVGAFVRDHREEVVLASKLGLWSLDEGRRIDGRPETVGPACDASLKRLGVDHIDVYYLHRVDPEVPVEETVGAMAELVAAGKVHQLGLSEPTVDELRRGHMVHPLAVVQLEWSLWARGAEAELVPTARELGIGIVPFGPLGRGFLTGALDGGRDDMTEADLRRTDPRLQGEHLAENRRLVIQLGLIAEELGATPAQTALAWVFAQGDDVVPIPGMEKRAFLDENLGALTLDLGESLQRLDDVFAVGVTAGDPDEVLLRRR
jgi:aryl-alcohol dehydrogenase-like predicted oxidoreductase